MSKHVRPLAICVFSHQDRILVSESYDPVKSQYFYRPLGGRIEFGEYAVDTLHREIQEEIGAQIAKLRYLGTLENIFTYAGKPGHEIILVYDGELVDRSFYEKSEFQGFEADNYTGEFKCLWIKRNQTDIPVYPDGLMALLDEH
jgi:8-oxo-dGTP pyrophosphatase MutT (NUDIX family)